MIIGICGAAGSGKDTFFLVAQKIIKDAKRFAFADELKKECNDLLSDNVGISSFTDCPKEKEMIRPLLVYYGTHIRRKLDPNCWVNKIKKSVLSSDRKKQTAFITDVRYPNELEWIHSSGGKCIFINREKIVDANVEEKENNKILVNLCEHSITWPTVGDNKIDDLTPIVRPALKQLMPCR